MRQIPVIIAFAIVATCACTASLTSAANATLVRGVVREQDTERPVAGVVIVLSNGESDVRVKSDAEGRYECHSSPGIITGQIVEASPEFVRPLRAFRAPVLIASDPQEQTLPPIELQRGQIVRGHVIDERGRLVRGAEVHAAWYVFEPWQEGRIRGSKSLVTKTDERGEFVFRGIDPSPPATKVIDRQPRFWASSADGATERLQTLPTQPDAPLELRLSSNTGVRLAGRVTDGAGQGVGGARIEVWTQWRNDMGIVLGEAPVVFEDAGNLVTNDRGRFETPCLVSRGGEYQVWVRAEGYLAATSEWRRPGQGAAAEITELLLRPLQTVSGRVVDVDGVPVSGARIFQSGNGADPTEAVSGDDGRFKLSGVPMPAFVFADREGHRFIGQAVDDATAIKLVLSRKGESIAPLVTESPVLSRVQELELARRVARPYVDRALESPVRSDLASTRARFWALITWARLDPGDALEQLDGGVIPDLTSDDKDVLRTWAAKSLLYDDLDEAAALVAAIEDNSRRAEANVLLAVTAPSYLGRAREYLERAVLCARQEEAGARALWLECAADGLLNLGEVDRGRSLLAEALDVTVTLPNAGSAGGPRRLVADVMARIDLPAAIELFQGTAEDAYRDDGYGRIAYRIAHQQPAESERVLGMVADHWQRERWAERVCSRMAPADPARAERLVALITNPYRRALTLGWMAGTIAASDNAKSRVWLDDAFAQLGHIVAAGEARLHGPQSAAVSAALLLPVAGAIDPQLAREYFWRAISFRRSTVDGDEQQALTETAALALLLARYDRPTALQLLEPIVESLERRAINDASECGATVVNAMCAIDPQWAADFLKRQTSEQNLSAYDDYLPWVVFSWFMGTPPEPRTRLFLRDYLDGQYWLPGGPDNPFHSRF